MYISAGILGGFSEAKLALVGLAAVLTPLAWWAYRLARSVAAEPPRSTVPTRAEDVRQTDPKSSPLPRSRGTPRSLLDRLWRAIPGQSFEAKFTFLGFLLTAPPALWWAYQTMHGRDIETTGIRIEQQQRTQSEDIKELKRLLQERLDQRSGTADLESLSASGPAPSPSDGLGTDLEAGIETLLKAGRETVLRDKTGEAAQSALDDLIAKREAARDRIAKDEAALWRQKGAFAFLENTDSAIRAYSRAAELDPGNAMGWLQLGRLQTRGGYLPAAKASFERLLALRSGISDPQLVHWAHMLMGDVEAALGNRPPALVQYDQALVLIKALAERDPANAEWQRDLSVSYDRVGDIRRARGDRDGALASYEDGLRIAKALAERDPANAEWQTDLVVSAWKLASAGTPEACGHLRNGLAILKRLDAENRLTADQKDRWIPAIEGAIANGCG